MTEIKDKAAFLFKHAKTQVKKPHGTHGEHESFTGISTTGELPKDTEQCEHIIDSCPIITAAGEQRREEIYSALYNQWEAIIEKIHDPYVSPDQVGTGNCDNGRQGAAIVSDFFRGCKMITVIANTPGASVGSMLPKVSFSAISKLGTKLRLGPPKPLSSKSSNETSKKKVTRSTRKKIVKGDSDLVPCLVESKYLKEKKI